MLPCFISQQAPKGGPGLPAGNQVEENAKQPLERREPVQWARGEGLAFPLPQHPGPISEFPSVSILILEDQAPLAR